MVTFMDKIELLDNLTEDKQMSDVKLDCSWYIMIVGTI